MKRSSLWGKICFVALSALVVMAPINGLYYAEESAEVDPLGAYDETVTVNIGRVMLEANWPEGQSYEDNILYDYIENKLNINIEFAYDTRDTTEAGTLQVLDLTSGTLPDAMMCETNAWAQMLESGELADLSEALDTYGEGYTKDWLQSYQDVYNFDWKTTTTNSDGELVGIPRPVDAENRGVYVRQDWIDELGLTVDEDGDRIISLEELEMLAQAFKDNDPDGTGNNVGLSMHANLKWTSVGTTTVDSCFGVDHALFYTNDEGNVVYGGVIDPEGGKKALAWWQDMYKKGLVDPEYITDTWDNECLEKWTNGQCGIIFSQNEGPTWMFPAVYEANPDARFSFYSLGNAEDPTTTNAYVESSFNRCVAVRKDYEHPEVVIKIMNVIIDLITDENLATENPELYSLVTDGTFQYMDPLIMAIKVQGNGAKIFADVEAYAKGEAELDSVSMANRSYAEIARKYLEDPKSLSGTERAQAEVVLQGWSNQPLIAANNAYVYLNEADATSTEAFSERWTDLFALEGEYWHKIITGELPIDAWDEFVPMWYEQGGQEILDEVQAKTAG